MGIRDSKALSPKVRARLFGEIMKIIDSVCIHKIDPVEVDGSVLLRGLNRLEAKVMASVINTIGAEEVYVDCCDVNPQRYREYMECHLTCKPKLYSMHHADVINMVVSAAINNCQDNKRPGDPGYTQQVWKHRQWLSLG